MPLPSRLTLLSCLVLAACGPKASQVNVQATWGKNLSELGITPIYPPREDVFVGDIQLYVQNPCDTGATSNQPQAILMGGIPLADIQAAMEAYYAERPQLPSTTKPPSTPSPTPAKATPAAQSKVTLSTPGSATISVGPTAAASPAASAASAGSSAVPPEPTADAKNPIFPAAKSPSPVTRLRMVAFPDFSYSDFTSGGIGATIPVHSAKITAGVSNQNGRHGNVSVSQVEEAMLPAPVMLHLVNDYLHGPHRSDILNRSTIGFLKALYEQNMMSDLGCTAPGQHSSKPAYVVFITRVFYARTFDYQFSQSDATAASLRLALAGATATTAAAQTAAPASPAASNNAAQAAADAAASSLKSLTSSTTPGGAASLEIGSEGGLALKQTFDRPLAFGVGQPIVFDADETLAKTEAN